GGTPDNDSSNPKLFQVPIAIEAANQTKLIESISFTKTSSDRGYLNIFGVSAEIVPTCPSPELSGITSTTTMSGATVSWVAPAIVPSGGYDYYLTTSTTEVPDANTTPTGNTAITSIMLDDLTSGTQYAFWLRSNCGSGDLGIWRLHYFTPGQTTVTYTDGDIPTQYGTPTVTSTNYCTPEPTLTVDVPAGYRIASITTKYDMTAHGGAWRSEQRSFIYSPTLEVGEESISNGSGSSGLHSYERNIDFANGQTGSIDFVLRTWRTWGGSGCGTSYNYVNNNTWELIVSFEEIPSCFEPADLTATDITATGATLSWTSDGSLFDVEILEEGEDPTGVPTYEGVSNNFTTTIPLTGSTIYNYWVRQDCGDDDLSIWAGPYSFTTACVPVETLPYVESFD